jgi:hypothetical protein
VRLGRFVREAGVQLQAWSSKDVRRTREVRRGAREAAEKDIPQRQRCRRLVRLASVFRSEEPATKVVEKGQKKWTRLPLRLQQGMQE